MGSAREETRVLSGSLPVPPPRGPGASAPSGTRGPGPPAHRDREDAGPRQDRAKGQRRGARVPGRGAGREPAGPGRWTLGRGADHVPQLRAVPSPAGVRPIDRFKGTVFEKRSLASCLNAHGREAFQHGTAVLLGSRAPRAQAPGARGSSRDRILGAAKGRCVCAQIWIKKRLTAPSRPLAMCFGELRGLGVYRASPLLGRRPPLWDGGQSPRASQPRPLGAAAGQPRRRGSGGRRVRGSFRGAGWWFLICVTRATFKCLCVSNDKFQIFFLPQSQNS